MSLSFFAKFSVFWFQDILLEIFFSEARTYTKKE